MSDDLRDLQQQYRRVKAPAHLATRIRAQVSQTPARFKAWIPVAGLVTVACGVLSVALIMQQQSTSIITPPRPSLTMLSSLTPDKPGMSMPGLSRIRSVRTPPLPPKPDFRKPEQPQSHLEIEEQGPKETDYA